MSMDIDIDKYARANKVKVEWENADDARFTCPKGKTFGNGTQHRFIEDVTYMSDEEFIGCLSYS